MNKASFHAGMKLLADTWPERSPDADTLSAYWLVLEPLHDSAFEAAIAACLRSCTYYPKPAQILSKAQEALTAAGVLPSHGEEAWAELLSLLHHWSPDNGWCAPYDPKTGWGPVGGPNGYYGAPSPLDE